MTSDLDFALAVGALLLSAVTFAVLKFGEIPEKNRAAFKLAIATVLTLGVLPLVLRLFKVRKRVATELVAAETPPEPEAVERANVELETVQEGASEVQEQLEQIDVQERLEADRVDADPLDDGDGGSLAVERLRRLRQEL